MLIDVASIIKLDASHLAGGLALSRAAGWNQTQADWQLLISAGNAIGMVDETGKLIATALTLPHGSEFGWISMVLVDEAHRGRGHATRLLKTCVATLERARLVPVLDATELGEPIYRSLGFEVQFSYQRWAIETPPSAELMGELTSSIETASLKPVTEEDIFKIDENVFGGRRRQVLQNLMARSSGFSAMTEAGDGFVLGREGELAWQIGPISAASCDDALGLLTHAISHTKGPIFIDACERATKLISVLQSAGFQPQRRFMRMANSAHEVFGSPERCFALAGPELG